MVDTQLSHPTYKIVDEKEADALAWVFVDSENMKKIAFKFPELKSDQIRAKVTYVGLCHSDSHYVKADWFPVKYPVAPGHEIVGEVTHLGSEVTGYKVGDKVGFGVQRDCCEKCDFCLAKDDQFCQGKLDQTWTYGNLYWGGYATAIQHPAKFFFKLPANLPEEKIPPLFCAGVTTYAPIARYSKPGNNVAVIGIGGLGHMAVKYARAFGCKVTAFTTSKDKEQFIKDLGADRVVITSEETMKQEAGKYHLIINTLPTAEQVGGLVILARPCGVLCQVGAPPMSKPSSFSAAALIFGQISIAGSSIGSRKDIREMLEFSSKHNIVPICEEFDYEDFPKAYNRMLNERPVFRCVVNATKASPKQ